MRLRCDPDGRWGEISDVIGIFFTNSPKHVCSSTIDRA